MKDFYIGMGDFKILNEMEDFEGLEIRKISIPFRFIACPGQRFGRPLLVALYLDSYWCNSFAFSLQFGRVVSRAWLSDRVWA